MAGLCSLRRESSEDREKRRRDRTISRRLREDRKKELQMLKLLLMGTGESGKSTIQKQMKIIHINGFSKEERQKFVANIRKNLKDSIIALVAGMSLLRLDFSKEENIANGKLVLEAATQEDMDFPESFYDRIQNLWNDHGLQECYRRSNEFQLIDSAAYFINHLTRIRQHDYNPSDQDILRCRTMTTAISSVEFYVKESGHPVQFKVYDVGGQRGERKKWIQLFSEVTAILFICDCSSFNQRLIEDRSRNRLLESFEIFLQIWRHKYLQDIPVLVFINKIDTLEQRIRDGHRLNTLFEELEEELNGCSDVSRSSDGSFYASEQSRKASRDSLEDISRILQAHPFPSFGPKDEDVKLFLNSYPLENSGGGSVYKSKKNCRPKETFGVHQETIRTACYIRHTFHEIARANPTKRKCLTYFTCAVNTDNIQKVMDGCRVFLMDKHLERFGIL